MKAESELAQATLHQAAMQVEKAYRDEHAWERLAHNSAKALGDNEIVQWSEKITRVPDIRSDSCP